MRLRHFLVVSIVVALTAVGWQAFKGRTIGDATVYRTAVVERGNLVSTIIASGAVNAVVTVDVGSQLSGQIAELLADFNDEVREGQPLARLDPESFEARVRQAEAELEIARAQLLSRHAAVKQTVADVVNARNARDVADANMASARAIYAETELDLRRKQPLADRGTISRSELERVRALRDSALAQLRAADSQKQAQVAAITSAEAAIRMSEVQVEIARANVKQQIAVLEFARVELARTIIRAPLDGVVIARNVELGQTVAASLQAPTLFTIAQDLRQMQVEANVDEADIGGIKPGQRAVFTVDAYPGRSFHGEIVDIHKSPLVFQNVVTYPVVVSADNRDRALLPGMTATIRIIFAERRDVLRVPNAALRFQPPDAVKTDVDQATANDRIDRGIGGGGGAGASDRSGGGGGAGQQRGREVGPGKPDVVWVPGRDGAPVAVRIRTGASDGDFTEVLSGPLKLKKAKKNRAKASGETPAAEPVSAPLLEGQEVIVGITTTQREDRIWGLRWGL